MSNILFERDFQQQNFLEILRRMQFVPGWEILRESKVLALKAPGPFPFVNFVWGDVTSESLQTVFSFYATQSFYWLLTPEQDAKQGR